MKLIIDNLLLTKEQLRQRLRIPHLTDLGYHILTLVIVETIQELVEGIDGDATLEEYLDHSSELFTTVDDREQIESRLVEFSGRVTNHYRLHLNEELAAVNTEVELRLEASEVIPLIQTLAEDLVTHMTILTSNQGLRTEAVRLKSIRWEPTLYPDRIDFPTYLTLTVSD